MILTDENKKLPYMAKGKWYRFFVESTGAALTLTEKDISAASIGVDDSGTYHIALPEGFHAIDAKYDIHPEVSDEDDAADVLDAAVHGLAMFVVIDTVADTVTSIPVATLPNIALFDYLHVYVFGYYD